MTDPSGDKNGSTRPVSTPPLSPTSPHQILCGESSDVRTAKTFHISSAWQEAQTAPRSKGHGTEMIGITTQIDPTALQTIRKHLQA
eukprot:SAG31_NODE_36014_length_317_cov_0.940367_1_plen_85_part_10